MHPPYRTSSGGYHAPSCGAKNSGSGHLAAGETVIPLHPPSTSNRRFNRDGERERQRKGPEQRERAPAPQEQRGGRPEVGAEGHLFNTFCQ